jgi:hypothetical protein
MASEEIEEMDQRTRGQRTGGAVMGEVKRTSDGVVKGKAGR